ncbi:para-nitrobenzyl esterase [Fusarium albosuccineum]|uniref:Carboxylic ester hydrolase n=1 Tax=Fusarium albosuccineum TaxID=1237068 RepID=A0A8H4L590_9HYPO|nr:para-nitrobenzyl esterase [Fusarium albosuccineum]
MFLRHHLIFAVAAGVVCCSPSHAAPKVVDARHDVTYVGLQRSGIEVFLNIPYGQDTGGENRFKPPRPYVPEAGETIQATAYGPACPQALGPWVIPISLTNVTEISEDCLNVNVARPKGTSSRDRLPVMVYIHGGSFWAGQNQELNIRPDGMIVESIKNGLPIIHVALNYRLGFFGFAQSKALRSEGSENAGLRDQRLAIEWVRKNIAQFGGDPNKITIFGQSSGGLSIGMQIMAFGGKKPVPFHQAICESQALEPGITGNFTIDAMDALVSEVDCNKKGLNSKATVECLRCLDMETLLNASIATYKSDIAHNIGDIWLPVVDGDFLPAAPSELIKKHQFADVTTMIGWCDDDVTFFTDTSIKTAKDTREFISSYVPGVDSGNIDKLLSLYPVSDFKADKKAGLSNQFYRAARIFRDILMTCQPVWYGEHIAAAGNDVYLYDWNQTILGPVLEYTNNVTGMGPIHTSEFAYIFGNLSHYDTDGFPFHPTPADYRLEKRGSRSWSTFASTGKPGLRGHDTFKGFKPAFPGGRETLVFVVGGPHEGLSVFDGPDSTAAIRKQKLRERCAFINSPEMIKQLQY